MNKEKAPPPSGWMQLFGELLKTDIYKRSQGRIVRQMTCLAVWVAVAIAAWRLFHYLRVVLSAHPAAVYAVPLVVLLVGLWVGYRLVNLPSFADFLIAVEAEMNKVSWPSKTELIRSSVVVIILMFGLTAVLFVYDLILTFVLRDVLRITV